MKIFSKYYMENFGMVIAYSYVMTSFYILISWLTHNGLSDL